MVNNDLMWWGMENKRQNYPLSLISFQCSNSHNLNPNTTSSCVTTNRMYLMENFIILWQKRVTSNWMLHHWSSMIFLIPSKVCTVKTVRYYNFVCQNKKVELLGWKFHIQSLYFAGFILRVFMNEVKVRAVMNSQYLDLLWCFTSVDKRSSKIHILLWNVTNDYLCYLCFVSMTVWVSVRRWTMLRGYGRSQCLPLIFWINSWGGHLDMMPG